MVHETLLRHERLLAQLTTIPPLPHVFVHVEVKLLLRCVRARADGTFEELLALYERM